MELLILIALFVILTKASKNKGYNNRRYTRHKKINAKPEWHSEWTWDEDKQLWVHPNSGSSEQVVPKEENPLINYQNAYQAKLFFTKNEWQNYKKLRAIAEVKGYIICPKVRLSDIIKPKSGEKNYQTLLNKIQSKHVDFVICDQNMYIKAIIELDDSSHNRPDRIERDKFVDTILQSVGYKVIDTRYVNNDILDLV